MSLVRALIRYYGVIQVMIRHTKSQRIGGDVALALPDSDSKTIYLDMTDDERTMYNYSRQNTRGGLNRWSGKVKCQYFELVQAKLRQACSHKCKSSAC